MARFLEREHRGTGPRAMILAVRTHHLDIGRSDIRLLIHSRNEPSIGLSPSAIAPPGRCSGHDASTAHQLRHWSPNAYTRMHSSPNHPQLAQILLGRRNTLTDDNGCENCPPRVTFHKSVQSMPSSCVNSRARGQPQTDDAARIAFDTVNVGTAEAVTRERSGHLASRADVTIDHEIGELGEMNHDIAHPVTVRPLTKSIRQ